MALIESRHGLEMVHSANSAFANAAGAAQQDGIGTAIRRHIAACVAIVAISVVLAMVVLSLLPEEYRATTIVSLENSRLQSMPNQLAITPAIIDAFAVKAAAEIVASPALAERALDTLQLWKDPELTEKSTAQRMISEVVGAARSILGHVPVLGTWLSTETPGAPSSGRDRIRERFRQRVLVSQSPQSLLLTIGYASADPEKAARVANTLAALYLDFGRQEKVRQISNHFVQLQKISDRSREHMIAVQSRLKDYRDQLGIIDLSTTTQMTASAQHTSDLAGRFLAARADRIVQEIALQELRGRARNYAPGVTIGAFPSPIIQQLEVQRVALTQRRAEAMSVHDSAYPLVATLSAQIRDIDRNIGSAVDNLIKSTAESVRVARSKEDALEQDLRASKAQNRLQSTAGAELVDLEAQAAAAKSMYTSSLDNVSRAMEAVSVQEPDARVISPATPPLSPSSPRAMPIIAFGAVLGAACAALYAYLREASTRRFMGIARLEDLSRAPLLGLLPRLGKSRRGPSRPTFQAMVDAMRLRLTSGAPARVETRGCVLLVTSALAEEGKSAVSSALAKASAEAGQRVLLIEGDTRKSSAESGEQEDGVAAVMDGKVNFASTILVERTPGLFVLPAGKAWNRAIGSIEYQRLQSLIGDATRSFDLVVIDSPPVLVAPDSVIYSTLADRVLFLIRWQTTPLAAATRAMFEVEQARPGASAICITHLRLRDIRRLSRNPVYGYGTYGRAYRQFDAT